MKQISHWINGAEYKGSGSRFGEVFDPALGTQAAQVSFAEEADIEVAVSSAQAKFHPLHLSPATGSAKR